MTKKYKNGWFLIKNYKNKNNIVLNLDFLYVKITLYIHLFGGKKMKNKFLYVFFAVTAFLFCFIFSASAGFDLDTEEILKLEQVDNYFECYAAGDVDNNGAIKADDARIILRASVELEQLDTSAFMKADVDGDGKVTAADARLALRLAVGLDEMPEHDIQEIVIAPATCATEGLTVKICTSCIKIYAKVTVPASTDEHITGLWETVTAPNCTNKGFAQLKCLVCGVVVREEELPATNRHSGEWNYPDGKSCLDPVKKNRTCTVCGNFEETVENPRGGHNFVWFTETANTCTEDGLDVYKCDYCGLQSKELVTNAHGHIFEHDVVITEPTCEETGLNAKQCIYCGETKEEYATAALGHKYDNKHYRVTKEPTCAEVGTADVVCTLCGDANEITLDKAPHTLTDEWVVTLEPDCTNEGSKSGNCRYCGPVTEVIPANGHTVTSWTNVKPATCSETGLMQGECSVCGDAAATKEIEKLPHDFNTSVQYWTSGILCKENGTGYYKCNNCDAKQQLILLQRTCTNKNGKNTRVVTEATCTSKKTVVDVCDFCKEDIEGTLTTSGKALGHNYDTSNWEETKSVTCTTDGERQCGCTRCDQVKTEVIKATGHTAGEWAETTAATCSKAGEMSLLCSSCNEVIDTREIEKLAHTPKNTVIADSGEINENGDYVVKCKVECSVCGETISEEEPVTRMAVRCDDGIKVVFDEYSDFNPGGEISFTIENAAENMLVMMTYGVDGNEILTDEDGTYYYTIPDDISDSETLTIVVVILS